MNDILEFKKKASKIVNKKKEITEVDIENTFVKFAKSKGCKAIKLIFLKGKGFPDRTVFCPEGRIFFIEFKRKGKKQTKTQIIIMNWLKRLGFKYYVCDEIGQAERRLKTFLDAP